MLKSSALTGTFLKKGTKASFLSQPLPAQACPQSDTLEEIYSLLRLWKACVLNMLEAPGRTKNNKITTKNPNKMWSSVNSGMLVSVSSASNLSP